VTYRLVVTRRAKADVRTAARRYEVQRPELGREFVAEVDATLRRVAENPLHYQALHRETRRAIVHRFPYGTFYRIEGNTIVVLFVGHLHRDPALWAAR
jgi:plasmid stabilization system protein ParE